MATITRKYYPGITLFKFIGSIMVLTSHISLPGFLMNLANDVTGLEQFFDIIVPCFYLIAGFLAYNGWVHAKSADQYIKKYLAWLIGLYLLISLTFMSLTIFPKIIRTGGSAEAVILSIAKRLVMDLFIRGPVAALWFIPPLIFGIAMSYFFERRNKLIYPVIFVIVGYLTAQLYNGTFRSLTEAFFGDVSIFHIDHVVIYVKILKNYFGMGLPFVVAGVVLAKYQDWFIKLNGNKLALLAITFVSIEALLLYYCVGGRFQYRLVLSMVPLSIWLFYGLLKVQKNRVKAYHTPLNLLSMVIYFSHGAFIRVNMYLLGLNIISLTTTQSVISILLTLAECIALTAVVLSFKKKSILASSKSPGQYEQVR
jgi:hypothetical protein